MGRLNLNDKPVVTPDETTTPAQLRELEELPANTRFYERRGGRVLDDNESIRTEGADLGVVESWERGE